MEKNYGSYLNFYKYFLHFKLLTSNTIKNEIRKKFKKLLGSNLVKYSSEFLAHIKKHLGHIGAPTNVQNNCIKLSGFGVDITKLFLHWEITRNISCREKFSTQKFLRRFLGTNLTHFQHYLCHFFSGRIKLVTKFF